VEAKIAAHIDGLSDHFESECRVLHKDGTYRWMLNRGLALRNRDARAYRMAGSQTDITDRKIAEEQLLHDAFHDALTGLPNRALFMDRLNRMILGSRRSAVMQYAVLFLDIDRFKYINDSKGHTVGDLLLIAVSRRLSECLRPTDTLARLGGDEFAVLLEDITIVEDAEDVAGRVLKGMSQPFRIQDHELFTSASIGIAMGNASYTQPDQILRDADIAMYHAKAKGKACYEVFRPAMHDKIVNRLQLEADLHRAVERNEFLLHYQPIMDLKTRKLRGFEALIRWRHPERGPIYPKEFIPVAEETGLIFPISEWTFREACLQLRTWQEKYPAILPVTMSINISGKLFCWHNFTSILSDIISETGVSADCLVLEITETVILSYMETAEKTMTCLKDMGVHIHIDDFGTGYSSLNYLRKFPVSALKIDPSFINKITTSGGQREIIGSIVSLASSLNMDVIAEGVEMSHQLFNIRGMKCRYAQGLLFSAPMEPAAMDNWMTGVISGKLEQF
jgi:diguanylate cyclase (GGDEF)-like protein